MSEHKSNNGNDGKVKISTDPISPSSKKIYVAGSIHPQIRVPFREVSLTPTIVAGTDGAESKQVPN